MSALPAVGQSRLKLLSVEIGGLPGALHVYARRGEHDNDFSAGLVAYDATGASATLMRVNGPHPGGHRNRLVPTVILPVAPHIHYLTFRYQEASLSRPKIEGDGLALLGPVHSDVSGALDALAARAHIFRSHPPLPLAPVKKKLP